MSGGCSRESSEAISCGGDVGLSVVASISESSPIDGVAEVCGGDGGEDGDGGVAGVSSCEDVVFEVFLRADVDVVVVAVVAAVTVSSTDVLAVEACFGEDAAVVVVVVVACSSKGFAVEVPRGRCVACNTKGAPAVPCNLTGEAIVCSNAGPVGVCTTIPMAGAFASGRDGAVVLTLF